MRKEHANNMIAVVRQMAGLMTWKAHGSKWVLGTNQEPLHTSRIQKPIGWATENRMLRHSVTRNSIRGETRVKKNTFWIDVSIPMDAVYR